jgi:hypothetical protein
MFALLAAGCGTEDSPTSSTPSAAPSPGATASPTGVQPFDQPLVPSKTNDKSKVADDKNGVKVAKTSVPGLLSSTDPDERARQVQAGIRAKGGFDPFASLPPILTFKTPVIASAGGFDSKDASSGKDGKVPAFPNLPQSTELRPIPQFPKFPKIARGPGAPYPGSKGTTKLAPPKIARGPNVPSSGSVPPIGVNTPPALVPLPAIPEPTLARAVEVSGVIVTMNGLPQAIVKAPNEPTSRYVSAGQRLSNGQILVKRIEVNAGSDPAVILEQNGVEVSRSVGAKAAPTAGGPTALVPGAPTFGAV